MLADLILAALVAVQQVVIRPVALPELGGGNSTRNAGANISVPTATFTSSGDGICKAGGARATYSAMNHLLPALYRNLVGSSHLEPVLLPPIENPLLAIRAKNMVYYIDTFT